MMLLTIGDLETPWPSAAQMRKVIVEGKITKKQEKLISFHKIGYLFVSSTR
jgi:hypothetical protein